MAKADINVDPEILRGGVQQVIAVVIENWRAQQRAYEEALALVTGRVWAWVGGHGGTGRTRAASNAYLDLVAETIQAKITELQTFIEYMQAHANNLLDLAERTEQADLHAANLLKDVAQDIGEVKVR
ncbi:hypothetical protein [Amycolatopsis magusensis]|uniref:WXG100 family type VII secretion target n=1 Tax=Amycolatopsis magusensis TaxID=882444 RepID=A0ABS4PWP5_9PSEU|nr:hypothetical protein [Amycolatopsis magusensis]MBP2183852.1 hypothetical protein [Amycolatopsis magusensis]